MVATVDGSGVVVSVVDEDGSLRGLKAWLKRVSCNEAPACFLPKFARRFSRARTPKGRETAVNGAVDRLMSL